LQIEIEYDESLTKREIPVSKLKHILSFTIAAAVLMVASPATAAVILTAGSTPALPGDTGDTLDIVLSNTGPSSIVVNSFNFEITVSNVAITFTDATTGTVAAPYIFSGHSLFGPDIATSGPGQLLDASDLFDTPASGATVGAGVTVGLGHVFFNVSNAASGSYTVSFNPGSAATSLSDPNGGPITIDQFNNGTITIPGASVPEPSAAIPVLAGLAWICSRRRRSQ
jgi:hypothetical protein